MNSSSTNLQLILLAIIISLATQINSSPNPYCQTSCGNVTIPFPFGTTSECCLDASFLITCNYSYNPPKPFLNLSSSFEVLDISLDGQLRVVPSVPIHCYDRSLSRVNATISKFYSSKFWISSTRNKFNAIGHDTYALVEGSDEWKPMSGGCKSLSDSSHSVLNRTCSGIGCCQTSTPRVEDFLVDILSSTNHISQISPSSYNYYGCAVESRTFELSSSELWDIRKIKAISTVLNWSIGNVTCSVARNNLSNYACRASHSDCSESSNGLGYNCKCLPGFQGNPYHVDGCQDINECAASPCEGTCTNFMGSYSCSCPEGFEGDGKKIGSGCHQQKSRIKCSMLFYVTFGFIFPAIGSSWIFWRRKQKKLIKLRTDLFERNGGFILEKMLERRGRLSIYTAEELKKATNNYDENNIMNRDHHSVGIEYKGELIIEGVSQVVTIKRCDEIDQRKIKAYISKLFTLSQVHHRNVVKLIGCCLETQVPLLVYEFVTHKTLYDYIHEDRSAAFLSWDILLNIAKETAGALAYMHSADTVPIFHGNLSSSDIFIHSTTKVQGFAFEGCFLSSDMSATHEYLDPDYLSSGKLTAKSDVYSFGVVLAEILTGKNVLEKVGGKHLAQYFVSSSTRDQCIRILDHRLVTDSNFEQLKHVAKLAERCLSVSSIARPTMKEVAKELESAIGTISSSTASRPNSRLQKTVITLLRRNKSL